ncbi:ComEC/Rec2-related protein [Proteiniclasticum ruminis]|uniref:ComEC/Rec2-related protein n=1 Tax=Proteiniclasticum ruminis TaxID=398199 RepID=A0A1I4YMC3_9CLOT|nr:ComEC/Rec2-related protein [Proteiniclasticum ruminis]
MYILGSYVLYFLICLYCWILNLYLLWISISAFVVVLVIKSKLKNLKIYVMIPILAFISVSLYYAEGIPDEVKVEKIYYNRLLVSSGVRLYWLEEQISTVEAGDRLMGDFLYGGSGNTEQGVICTLKGSNYKIYTDSIGRFRAFKNRIMDLLIMRYGEHYGGLMGSLVLGNQKFMNEERAQNMGDLGIMHILSISGFHFSLLEGALMKLRMKKIAPLVLIVYGVFLDSIPGYRTIISLIYRMFGKIIKKDTNALTGIFVGMFLQAFFMPYYIFKQGYLLTYLSSLGILIFYPHFLRYLKILPGVIRDSIALTCSALFLSFPVILSFSPDFSMGVFIGNFILVPLYSIITYISFLGVLASGIPVLQTVLYPFIDSFFLLSFYVGRFFSAYNSSVNLEHLSLQYVPWILTVYLLHRYHKKRMVFMVMIFALCLSLPLGTSVSVYSNYGKPYIRVIHNFRKYDMMDYRVAEKGFIPLRGEVSLKLGRKTVLIKPHLIKKGVPSILVNGKALSLSDELPYYRGVQKHHHILFWRDLVYKVH